MTYDQTLLADIGDRLRRGLDINHEERLRGVRDMVSADMQPLRDHVTAWVADTADIRALENARSVNVNVNRMLDNPRAREYSMPWFFSWMRTHRSGPFASPIHTTAVDERHTFQFWVEQEDFAPIFGEIDTVWMESLRPRFLEFGATRLPAMVDADNEFTQAYVRRPRQSTLAIKRFFRWLIAQGDQPPAVATPAAATIEQLRGVSGLTPELIAPWIKTFTRWVNEVGTDAAGMQTDWLTDTRGVSTLEGLRTCPDQLPWTLPRFVRWLEEHGQTAPDPTEPTVPSGDSVVPIGPEHPGWQEFWQRARRAADGAGYRSYYDTLAREFGVQPDREIATVRVTLDIDMEVAAGVTPRTADIVAHLRQHSPRVYDIRVRQRTPIAPTPPF